MMIVKRLRHFLAPPSLRLTSPASRTHIRAECPQPPDQAAVASLDLLSPGCNHANVVRLSVADIPGDVVILPIRGGESVIITS